MRNSTGKDTQLSSFKNHATSATATPAPNASTATPSRVATAPLEQREQASAAHQRQQLKERRQVPLRLIC